MTDNAIKLREKLEEVHSITKVQAHLEKIKDELLAKNKELKTIESQLKKEEKDVISLEGKGVRPLFRKILGDQEKQLEQERQEYLEISLKYNSAKDKIEVLEFEMEILQKKVLNLDKAQKELQILKESREQEILASPSSTQLQTELRFLLKKMDDAVLLRREVREAIDAGAIASQYLVQLANMLKKTLNWGTWGSNTYQEMVRRSNMAQANKLVANIQYKLDKFAKEMQDLGEHNMHFKVDREGIGNFTNFFFDNLITDWIIQKKIRHSLNNILMINDKIIRVVQSLNHELKSIESKMNKLQNERDQLIIA